MTVHVRWPAKNSGAFVFGLNFWFFWFKPKEQIKKSISLSEDLETTFLFFVLKQRKETKENSRPIRCGTFFKFEISYDELATRAFI